ncbi:MAG: bifunctional (p)ppGpp synthetase/guanosine-3',5'-bis(diphosphate) 3'-pyrophosphohydrolase [Phycisphaeraceae bacterium]|nr:bifunctional (p)ppGpp synthetase/guanosine-3',5'-bis(diphosphate) 3'-pyrophosphohydrolase [Phycisphaeraceae bacterium]
MSNSGLPLWQRAASYAARAHRNHFRRDDRTPYVAHVMRVALTVRDLFGCEDPVALAAALLHDTIEDTTTDFDDLEREFGLEVARCVACLTKNMILREPEREEDYDERLRHGPWQARLVKLADVFDNLSDAMSERKPKRLGKNLSRCGRAIDLAKAEADRHPEVARGIARVRELMARVEAEA